MIFIAVENWAREFEYKMSIARIVAKSSTGFVVVAPKNFINMIIKYVPGVYLHKSLQRHFEEPVRMQKKLGGRYLVIDEEAVIRDIDLSHRYGIDPKCVDVVFCASNKELESLKSFSYGNIICSGNPRFLVSENRHKCKAQYPTSILFSSNFSMIRPVKGLSIDRVIEDQSMIDEDAYSLRKFIEMHRNREKDVRKILIRLSRSFKVTYRIHPLERMDLARKCFQGTGVLIEKGGNIVESIKASDVVLHAGCSVAMDSALLGKKSGWLFPTNDEMRSDKAKLSLLFPGGISSQTIFDHWQKGGFVFGDASVLQDLIGDIVNVSREESIKMIAEEVLKQYQYIPQQRFVKAFSCFFRMLTVVPRWTKNFYFTNYERERFDKKSYAKRRLFDQYKKTTFMTGWGGVVILKGKR